MDTSEKYIEMCRKATKIQRQWHPKIGDVVGDFDTGNTTIINAMFHTGTLEFLDGGSVSHKATVTWLPQQDRLQEMIISETKFYLLSLNEFLHKSEKDDIYFYSWEQLWLGFVMYKEFGKRWNGSEWEMI